MVWSAGAPFGESKRSCVTINWRTGADGFLYLGDGDDAANLGLRDQVAALTWVRDNIAAFGLSVDAALTFYRARYPNAIPGDLLAAVLTDWWVRLPALRLADAHAPGRGATHVYEFAWPSPVMGGRLGACHALKIPFVFDTLDLGHQQMLGGALGQNPPQHLADTMHRAWVEFARHGDPGWPRYEPSRRAVMRFGETTAVLDDPYAAERDLWSGVR
jgi:para-nitrobenzyl esterase